jgi:hypothetical protein
MALPSTGAGWVFGQRVFSVMVANSMSSQDRTPGRAFQPQLGDLVINRTGHPLVQEVIGLREDGLLRVRGLDWPPGYSALIALSELRPVTGRLRD